eukprot:jgi/Tetstr1/455840/TSEL_042631.t1
MHGKAEELQEEMDANLSKFLFAKPNRWHAATTADHLNDADPSVMEREAEAASGSQKELTAFLDQANNTRLNNEVGTLPVTCKERILFGPLDAASGMWEVAIPTARKIMTPQELWEVAAGLPFPVSVPDDYPPACAAEGGHIRVLDWMWLMKHADFSDAIHCGLRASSPVPLEFRWVLGYLRLQQGKAMCCGVVVNESGRHAGGYRHD